MHGNYTFKLLKSYTDSEGSPTVWRAQIALPYLGTYLILALLTAQRVVEPSLRKYLNSSKGTYLAPTFMALWVQSLLTCSTGHEQCLSVSQLPAGSRQDTAGTRLAKEGGQCGWIDAHELTQYPLLLSSWLTEPQVQSPSRTDSTQL